MRSPEKQLIRDLAGTLTLGDGKTLLLYATTWIQSPTKTHPMAAGK